MSKRVYKNKLQFPSGKYEVRVRYPGFRKTVTIHSPVSAYNYLEAVFESRRAELIREVAHMVRDVAEAEDIVQFSLTNICYTLNNGKLYIIALPDGDLFVKGGELFFWDVVRLNDERLLKQWYVSGEEERKKIVGISFIEKPVAWLRTIVLNNAYKYCKQQKKFQSFLVNPKNWLLVEDPKSPNPEKVLLNEERFSELRGYVSMLPEHYRSVIQLRFFQDREYSFQEIADALGRDVHTVTSQATRAFKILGDVIKGRRVARNGRLVLVKESA